MQHLYQNPLEELGEIELPEPTAGKSFFHELKVCLLFEVYNASTSCDCKKWDWDPMQGIEDWKVQVMPYILPCSVLHHFRPSPSLSR